MRRIRLLPLLSIASIAVTAAGYAQDDSRTSLVARAQVWTPARIEQMDLLRGPSGPGAFPFGAEISCRFVQRELSGTSPKFACALSGGDELKVKYGDTNGEVHGEVLATRLLWALGFGADAMYSVRVLCEGCPSSIGLPSPRAGERIVDPSVVERKMPGREINTRGQAGWSWLELDLIDEMAGGAPVAQRDALKLLAVLMQHTDSKPEQQRLMCLDDQGHASPAPCERPFMMINDVGLTFGRANVANSNLIGSVNFAEWARTPIWKDDARCVGNLPRSLTGTLKDPVISETGREFLARRLTRLSDEQLRDMFRAARVELRDYALSSGPPPAVDDWVNTFKAKREQIVNRRCDALWPGGVAALFGTGPVKWLQARASTPLTVVMNVVSLFGYTRVYLALAVALAFLFRFRAGAALVLLLALNGVLVDAAKAVVASPRPGAIDEAVHNLDFTWTLGSAFSDDSPAPSVDSDDGYGFPSGHVAVMTVFFFGLGYLFRWRGAWRAVLLLVPAMAIARLYLGRHFLGDVLGGVGVGVIAVVIGLLALTLHRLADPNRERDAAIRTLLVATGAAILAYASGVGLYDAGRLFGLAASVTLLVRYPRTRPFADGLSVDSSRLRVRIARVVLCLFAFAGSWWVTQALLDVMGVANAPFGALLAGALPAFVILPAPIYLERLATAAARTRRAAPPPLPLRAPD